MLVIRRGPATSGNGHRNLLETLVMKKRGSICKMNLNFYNRACWAGSVENCLGDETAKPEASPIGGKVAFRSAKETFPTKPPNILLAIHLLNSINKFTETRFWPLQALSNNKANLE